MKSASQLKRRRSIRLKDFDYSQAGSYFVTICTQNRQNLLGEITQDVMQLNQAGLMVNRWYRELENKFRGIQCDEFICMPNHIHFIVNIINTHDTAVGADLCVPVRADLCVRPNQNPNTAVRADLCVRPINANNGQTHRSAPTGSPNLSSPVNIPTVVQWLKTMTTNEYIRGVKQNGWQPFPGKLWQRNYWEHIIRNETEREQIREYIVNNPKRWQQDKLFQHSSPVGADLCVRPNNAKNGQTHRSAPTDGQSNHQWGLPQHKNRKQS